MLTRLLCARDAFARFRGDRSGATAIEYALIAALVGLGLIGGLGGTKGGVAAAFQSVMDRCGEILGKSL